MRWHSAEAILLSVTDLHDRDRVVTFLTREHGKRRGVARSARAKYSRFAGHLQPLAQVEISWFEKEGRDLVRIGDVSLVRPAHQLRDRLEDLMLGAYLAEHLVEFAQENEASDGFYRLLDTSIVALLAGQSRALVARYFEVWILRLAGVFPPPRECPGCDRDLTSGAALGRSADSLTCVECAGPGARRASAATVEFLRRSARQGIAELAAETGRGVEVLEQVEAICADVRCRFLQRELRSRAVMKRVSGE